MANWSNNNVACRTTWTTLLVLNQIDEVFGKTGAIKMPKLTSWSNGDSPALRKRVFLGLSIQMDNVFRAIRKAKFETGVTRKKAVAALLQVFLNKTKTVADLAEVADASYQFLGESDEDQAIAERI